MKLFGYGQQVVSLVKLALILAMISAAGCATTEKANQQGETPKQAVKTSDSITVTGTFLKKSGGPATNLNIVIFEADKNGRILQSQVTMTVKEGRLVLDAPGQMLTDSNGQIKCVIERRKFKNHPIRITLTTQYAAPDKPNNIKSLPISTEIYVPVIEVNEESEVNLDALFGKMIVDIP